MEEILKVENLVKVYGDQRVVNEISFQVYKGEIFGLLGPNGAGKTTTMEMIEGLRKPDGGCAAINGYDIVKEKNKVKQVIGVQLQSTSLFELLKVKEIMQVYASFYPSSLPIDSILADVSLTEKENSFVKQLSGGQKQRLAIALALVNDPAVIFLDEPTTGLDPQSRRALWDIILRLKKRGKTIFLSTHYMDEAQVLCDRIAIMDRGKIIALDTPNGLVNGLNMGTAIEFHKEELILLSTLESISGVRKAREKEEWVTLYSDDLQSTLTDLFSLTADKGIQLTDLRTRTATLEDVFLSMTGRRLREE